MEKKILGPTLCVCVCVCEYECVCVCVCVVYKGVNSKGSEYVNITFPKT